MVAETVATGAAHAGAAAARTASAAPIVRKPFRAAGRTTLISRKWDYWSLRINSEMV